MPASFRIFSQASRGDRLTLCAALSFLAASLPPFSAAAASSPPSYQLARTIPLPGTAAQGWDYLACDPLAHRVYVAHGPEVDVIDTLSGQLAGKIGGLSRSHGIAIDARDGRGFISSGDSNTVVVFDLATLRVVQTIPVAAGPDAIVYEPISGRVLVFSGAAKAVTIFDAKTNQIYAVIQLAGTPEFAAASRHGLVYDNLTDRNEIVEIDPRVMVAGDTYPVAPGSHPTGMAVDLRSDRLFSGCSNQTLIAMDDTDGVVISSVPIGAEVDACAFDPDLHRVFESSGGSATISVIIEQKGVDNQYIVAATIPTLPGARTMTLDTKTHHLFVAAPSHGAVVVLEYAPVEKR